MDFELSEEQAMLRAASRDLLRDRTPIDVLRARSDQGPSDEGPSDQAAEVDPALWRSAADMGWTGLALPEEYGGSGQGLVELALLAEEIGRAVAHGPFLPTALVGQALVRGGSEPLRADVLPALATGTAWATWAFAEPHSPWTPDGVHATARTDADTDTVALDGVKTAVQDADGARWLLVTARHEGTPASFLVDRDAPGVTVRRQRVLDLTRTFCEVRLDGVRVPSDRRLRGDPTDVQRLLDDASVLLSAETLGVLDRMLEMTVEYMKTRVQFGRPLGTFQAVQHKCATMALLVHGIRAATAYAAMAADAGAADAARAACVAASYTSAATDRVAGESLQLHGGIGFTWEHDLHLYLRRAKADSVLYGDAAIHRERLCGLVRQTPVPV